MWLLYLLFINLLLALSSLFVLQSSIHLHLPIDCTTPQPNPHIKMCFAKTKTLKLLRERNHSPNTTIDLGFNWEDNCNYLPFDDLDSLGNNNSHLRVIQLNIRGMKGKLDELSNLLVKLKYPDVVILNETCLKDSDTNRIKIDNYVFSGRPRVNKKGGGVGFLIRTDITYRQRHDLERNEHTPSCEHSCIEIKGDTENTIISSMYRPPNTDVNDFLNIFKTILANIKRSGLESIIGLDHNLDLLKQAVHTKTQEFLECILDQNMLPTVTKPTRISKTSATLIDNILISEKLQSNFESTIIIDDMSDHLPCILTLKNYINTHSHIFRRTQRINSCTVNKMLSSLSKIDWTESLNNKNATESFTVFHKTLTSIINNYAPEQLVKKKMKKYTCPWMSKGYQKSLLKSKRLYAKSLTDPSTDLEYKTYKSVLRKCKRKLKLTYYQSKCIEFRNNGKKMWELINKINGKCSDKTCIIDKLSVNNIQYTKGKDIANNFAKYFSTVGKDFANKTMPPQTPLSDYVKKIQKNPKTMYFQPASVEEVSKVISGLKPKTSSGYDNISNKLLKQLHPVIIVPLTEIINRSMCEGCFPDSMKLADTIPLYKAKERDNTSNYRPISLLLTLSKILEKIVHKRTVSFLDRNNIIYNSQYGFREKHSTTDAVMELTTEILKAKENHQKQLVSSSI